MMLSVRGSQTSMRMRIMHSGVKIAQPLTLPWGLRFCRSHVRLKNVHFLALH